MRNDIRVNGKLIRTTWSHGPTMYYRSDETPLRMEQNGTKFHYNLEGNLQDPDTLTPAVEGPRGSFQHWNFGRCEHPIDAVRFPAYKKTDGTEVYQQFGKPFSRTGPAIINKPNDAPDEYWLGWRKLTFAEWNSWKDKTETELVAFEQQDRLDGVMG